MASPPLAVPCRFTYIPSSVSSACSTSLPFKFKRSSRPHVLPSASSCRKHPMSIPRDSRVRGFVVVDVLPSAGSCRKHPMSIPRESRVRGFVVVDVLPSAASCRKHPMSIPRDSRILPEDLRENLRNGPRRDTLLEVVLDLGRPPEARFLDDYGGHYLRSAEVSEKDLEFAQNAIGEFGGDNRAGIEGTLHRISAIRSRKGLIVGLTCRIGRSVTGHVDMVRDLLQYKESILFLGRPGVGKTTVMREIACVLADELHRRVVIVDTSNEIGGDGDIPHAAIGGARRMQVPKPSMQHEVMIEAVENHMPQVIIVDEIGREAEALACRSIAERGVMLLGTAHGERIENIIKNPTLSDLVGGVQTVTLGDKEAQARSSQKSVLERKAPPTFPFFIEMREKDYWVVHRMACEHGYWNHTDRSVDALLRGGRPLVEVKKRDENFKVVTERWVPYDGDGI